MSHKPFYRGKIVIAVQLELAYVFNRCLFVLGVLVNAWNHRYKYDMKILFYGWTFDQFTMYLDSVELLRQATQWSLSAQPCILDVLKTILKLESEGKCFKEDGNPTHLSFFNTCMISRFYSSSWYLYSRSVLFLKRYLYSRSSTWHG